MLDYRKPAPPLEQPCGVADLAEADLAGPAKIRQFHFLLLDGANMLDFSAAVEALRVANELSETGLYNWSLCSQTGDPVLCSNGLSLPVQSCLPETNRMDCIVVCSGSSGFMTADATALQWLRYHYRRGGSLAGLSTGAFTLARAGVAGSSKVTTHWKHKPVFAELFPGIETEDAKVLVEDRIQTCGGGIASIDLILSLISEDAGHELAGRVAEACLHDFDPLKLQTQRAPVSARVGSQNPALVKILDIMEKSLQEPMTLEDILQEVALSKRQIERLFKQHLGTSPSRHYRNLRLDRARCLLRGTDMAVIEVAVSTGFSSTASFSKVYRARFGETPHADRRAGFN